MWSSLRCKWHFWWQCLWAYSVLSNLRHQLLKYHHAPPTSGAPVINQRSQRGFSMFFSPIRIFQLVTFFLDVVSWWIQKNKRSSNPKVYSVFVAFPPEHHIFTVSKSDIFEKRTFFALSQERSFSDNLVTAVCNNQNAQHELLPG